MRLLGAYNVLLILRIPHNFNVDIESECMLRVIRKFRSHKETHVSMSRAV